MSENLFVEVLLDRGMKTPLDYSVPPEWQHQTAVGMRVEVPLRSSLQKGTIAKIKSSSSLKTVHPICRLLSLPPLSPSLWQLAQWMSRYYCCDLSLALRSMTPPNVRKESSEKPSLSAELKIPLQEALSQCQKLRVHHPAQAAVLEKLLQQKKPIPVAQILSSLQISMSPLRTLEKKGAIALKPLISPETLLLEEEFFPTTDKPLHLEQAQALQAITQSIEKKDFSVHLLHGVTGSGKTEVYLQAIRRALEQNQSALLLVPEISLTSQTIERIRCRFPEKVAILHHRRSLKERREAWDLLQSKKIRIAIGARSAIFCPAQDLGVIILDEEHDGSYKQSEETPCYQGRDVAVMRAYLEKCPIILGSATPSLESLWNVRIGKYQLHTLSQRASGTLPKVQIVDMKQALEQTGGFTHFSPQLLKALKQRLEAGEQTLLFLNKRGYYRMQICASCRSVLKCPHCDLALTYHRHADHLHCHLCQFTKKPFSACPQCQSREPLQFKGFGTEHVERSLKALLPGVRTLRMDRDTTRTKMSHEELFKQFRAHKADVLIGTQMIAKGFHFPAATLVGVLNADAGLLIPDFRASERVFQLITQIAGRAGRAELPGEVILQTFLPNHPTLLKAARQEESSFYEQELQERRLFDYPPFCHLVKLLLTHKDPQIARAQAQTVFSALTPLLPPQAQLLPPSEAGHAKVKDLYRFYLFIKIPKIQNLHSILQTVKKSTQISFKVDVDPLSTFF